MTSLRRSAAILLAVAALGAGAAAAVEPSERLADPALEERARDLSRGLRCLVCQNQSIDDSNAELAADLRRIVRERLVAGDTDEEVVGFVVARYGDYVLLDPPLTLRTALLWFGPVLLFAMAAVAILVRVRRRATASLRPTPLTEEEKRRLEVILAEEDRDRS